MATRYPLLGGRSPAPSLFSCPASMIPRGQQGTVAVMSPKPLPCEVLLPQPAGCRLEHWLSHPMPAPTIPGSVPLQYLHADGCAGGKSWLASPPSAECPVHAGLRALRHPVAWPPSMVTILPGPRSSGWGVPESPGRASLCSPSRSWGELGGGFETAKKVRIPGKFRWARER